MFTIAVDLGGTVIKTGLLDGHNLVATSFVDANAGKGLEYNLPIIEKTINRLLKDKKVPFDKILGIGFSFPGLVNSTTNRILSTNKKYDDGIILNLNQWAKKTWGLPLYLENDARMALLGEWQYGAGKGFDNIVMVTIGTGIGSAVLMEGLLVRGKHFQAGNLGGHFTVNFNGPVCTCGNKGCMESEVSTWRLPQLIKANPNYSTSLLKNEELLDYKTLFRYASEDDILAKEILNHCYSVWSAGLINMIHAYDPEVIILGGGILQSAKIILPELQKRIDTYAWTPWGNVKLLVAHHINTAALYGAVALIKDELSQVS